MRQALISLSAVISLSMFVGCGGDEGSSTSTGPGQAGTGGKAGASAGSAGSGAGAAGKGGTAAGGSGAGGTSGGNAGLGGGAGSSGGTAGQPGAGQAGAAGQAAGSAGAAGNAGQAGGGAGGASAGQGGAAGQAGGGAGGGGGGDACPNLSQPCSTGLKGLCGNGKIGCIQGVASCLTIVGPGETNEVCNNLDDDCDGVIDNGLSLAVFYTDSDGDGFGAQVIEKCGLFPGFSNKLGDCNDGDPAVNPDAQETCNNRDDNCDTVVDGVVGGGALSCEKGGRTGVCTAGVCVTDCANGTGDCDGSTANGCETSLSTNQDCGDCGKKCEPANAGGQCQAGVCAVVACNKGFANCDGKDENGCETALGTDFDCGACGDSCAIAGGLGVCDAGVCKIASCNDGVGNCDGDTKNGCEATVPIETCNGQDDDCDGKVDEEPASSLCPAEGQSCREGACACAPGKSLCKLGTRCVDPGACCDGTDCPSGVCTSGTCAAASCADNTKNGDETAKDCGGACPGCATGETCNAPKDCTSGFCNAGVCAACTGIDDCQSGNNCVAGACVPALTSCAAQKARYGSTDGEFWLLRDGLPVLSYCDMAAEVTLCTETVSDVTGRSRDGAALTVLMKTQLNHAAGTCDLWAVRANDGYPLDNFTTDSCTNLGFKGVTSIAGCQFGSAYSPADCGFGLAANKLYRYGVACSGCTLNNGTFPVYTLQGVMNTAGVLTNFSGTKRMVCKVR